MRLLDKNNPPLPDMIESFMGEDSHDILKQFEDMLKKRYDLGKELKFPFGNNYGWGYKYSHKKTHLCYAFFEKNSFTVTMQLGDSFVPKIELVLPELSLKTKKLWEGRYPCGQYGGWIHYQVNETCELNDIISLLEIKKKPVSRQ